MPANKPQPRSFPSSCRLLHRHDFVRLSQVGKKWVSRHFILLVGDRVADATRLGITVSKKVGCAVVRNRLKRLVREAFRLNREQWPQAEIVVIARSSAASLSYVGVRDDLLIALLRVRG